MGILLWSVSIIIYFDASLEERTRVFLWRIWRTNSVYLENQMRVTCPDWKKGRKMKKCTCPDWKKGIDKINAPIILQSARSGGFWQYDGKTFEYCPWCGKVLLDVTPGCSEKQEKE